jgi:hypothetical protein
MKRFLSTTVLGVFGLCLTAASAAPPNQPINLRTSLNSFEEVPSKLTTGTGTFKATISADRTTITYTLTFSGLSSDALMSHIHFGQPGVAGGIFIFLCGGGGKPACPAGGGTVTGTVVASDVLAPSPDQGITAGSMDDAIKVILSGNAYVNVHTTRFPSGEIRGQVRAFPFFFFGD